MRVQRIDSEAAPAAVGGYARAVLVGDVAEWRFVGGQIAERPDGELPETFTDQ